MHRTARPAAAVLSLALVGVATTGVADARPGDLIPVPTPPPLTFEIHDAEVLEGDPGDGQSLSFEITGSRSSGADVTFRAHSGNLGFEATPGTDFSAVDEIVTMPAGATSTTVEVPVLGDLDPEHDELVIVWLSDPSAGSISEGTALGRILDDDSPGEPTIHISQETHAEGTGGPTGFHFTVSLSHAAPHAVSVDLTTTPGSATMPQDLQASPLTITFAPGQVTADYVVSVVGDAVPEPAEEFVVEMSNAVGGTIVGGGGLGTILNDDGPTWFGALIARVRALLP